ncbi:MAG: hypothetical protein V4485_05075 [Pseudomonadota bacterium]
MSPKQLGSILDKYPAATAVGQIKALEVKEIYKLAPVSIKPSKTHIEEMGILTVRMPLSLKTEIQDYVKKHKGETEKTIVLRALKDFGFKIIKDDWLVDKRSTR